MFMFINVSVILFNPLSKYRPYFVSLSITLPFRFFSGRMRVHLQMSLFQETCCTCSVQHAISHLTTTLHPRMAHTWDMGLWQPKKVLKGKRKIVKVHTWWSLSKTCLLVHSILQCLNDFR